MGEVDLRSVTSRDAFRRVLLSAQDEVPEGQWLVASGWTQEALGSSPDVSWFPPALEVPCLCYRVDFHSAVLNASALALLPLDEIKSVTGGSKVYSGIVGEDALYNCVCPALPSLPASTKLERTQRALKELQAKGVTLIGSMEDLSDVDETVCNLPLQSLMRISLMLLDTPDDTTIEKARSFSSRFLQVSGFKSFLDGSFGSRTAKMYEPWRDVDGRGTWAGLGGTKKLQKWIKKVSQADFAPVMHAIGDEAVGNALKAIQGVEHSLIARIEHGQFIADQDLMLLQNVMFGVQPLHQPADAAIALKAVGVKRAHTLHNWRRMLDFGALLSFGSDWPIAESDPLAAMQVAIANGLTVEESLHASTEVAANSLRALRSGRLLPGAFGDVAVLDANPFEYDWTKSTPNVVQTILDGNIVYEKEIL